MIKLVLLCQYHTSLAVSIRIGPLAATAVLDDGALHRNRGRGRLTVRHLLKIND